MRSNVKLLLRNEKTASTESAKFSANLCGKFILKFGYYHFSLQINDVLLIEYDCARFDFYDQTEAKKHSEI